MESPNRQAVKLLREQRRRRKRAMAFLCMAGIVVIGTVMALRMSGRAMNNMELDCVLSHDLPHQHSEECYYTPPEEGAERLLVCGTADFVVHKHDPEKCYDKNGNLVCMLQEIEEHIHTDACFQEQRTLSCGMQEGDGGHVHSESCYGPDRFAEPICGLEESEGHTHDENCLDEEGQLICGLDESEGHTHDDGCYPKTLTCGLEEGGGGHIHSEACYSTEAILACGKNEAILHTHTEECYLHTVDQLDQNQTQELANKGFDVGQVAFTELTGEVPAEENRVLAADGKPVLKCGKIQVLDHVHGDSCYKLINAEGELLAQLGSGSEAVDMPGQRSAVYQDATLRATAVYDGEDFPDNARISVERVDESEGLRDKQQQLSGILADDELQLKALLKVTVLCGDEGLELSEPVRLTVEPADQGEVTAAAWYDGNGGLDEQGVYFQSAKPELELLNMTKQENGGFETDIAPGAVVGIASRPAVESGEDSSENGEGQEAVAPDGEQGAGNTVFNISQSFEYEDEDYMMVFHIDGVARFKPGAADAVEPVEPEEFEDLEQEQDRLEHEDSEDGTGGQVEEGSQGEDAQDVSSSDEALYFAEPSDNADTPENGGEAEPDAAPTPETTPTPEPEAGPSAQPNNEPVEEAVTIAGDVLRANVLDDPERPLGLKVERMAEDSPEYGFYSNNIPIDNTETGLPDLQIMTYSLYYKGVELDLRQCTVTLDVTVSESVLEAAKELERAGDELQTVSANVAVATFLPSNKVSKLKEDETIYSMPIDGSVDSAQIADTEESFRESIENAISSDDIAISSFDEINETNLSTQTIISEPAALDDDIDTTGSDDQYVGIGVFAEQNPEFTIQYYAWLDVVDDSDSNGPIKVIDTAGGNLPINGVDPSVKSLSLDADGFIKTRPVATKIYSDIDAEYLERPNLQYLAPTGSAADGAADSAADNYELKQIWVLKSKIEGISSDTRVKYKEDEEFRNTVDSATGNEINNYWTTYGTVCGDKAFTPTYSMDVEKDMHLTNRPDSAATDRICISQNDILRLVYEPKIKDETENLDNTRGLSASFFDYDISDSVKIEGDIKTMESTKENGINSSSNYTGSGTKYTFGNANTGNKYSYVTWDKDGKNNKINSANRVGGYGTPNNSYMGCAFGMVTGLNLGNDSTNATPIFDNGISAPDIFGNSNLNGKHDHSGSLKFRQVGDTHTLSIASVDGASGRKNLEKFVNPSIYDGVQHSSKIWTNNFWPMDDASGATDFMFGNAKIGKDQNGNLKAQILGNQKFNGIDPTTGKDLISKDLPMSDDLLNHNSYFGMHFAITFDLEKIYEGPLEYLFFGDDDMWVFLTDEEGNSTLICDIGGVHSSVGEMVNLRDYLPIGSEGKYRLDFFYTERGASGSTCWMQYTLPSVRDVENPLTDDDYHMLKFGKEVEREIVDSGFSTENKKEKFDTDETFLFELTLRNSEGGRDYDDYNYYTYEYVDDGNGNPVKTLVDNASGFLRSDTLYNGACFPLKAGQWIEIPKMREGTQYTIRELGVVDWERTTSDKNQTHYAIKEPEDQEHEYEVSESGELLADKTFSGTISGSAISDLTFTNTFKAYQLPKTGGAGTHVFTAAGALMVMAAGCLLLRKRKK